MHHLARALGRQCGDGGGGERTAAGGARGQGGVIHVIGLGIEQPPSLSQAAQQVLAGAGKVIGSERQLDSLCIAPPQRRVLPKLDRLLALLQSEPEGVILASGDPLHYGIGAFLSRHFERDQLVFYPALSSIQALCHQLHLSQQEVKVVSLHGRPLANLRRHLHAGQRLLILSDAQSQPQHLAQQCQATGFGDSTVWVSEMIGYPEQRLRSFSVAQLLAQEIEFAPLHVSLIVVAGRGDFLPTFPGIEDRHFVTDGSAGQGLLSKREVRLAVLSLLQPARGERAWDIGAGCGGVAVEWAFWNPAGELFAIEHHAERLACLRENRVKFGVVANLKVVVGLAPAVLADLPDPDKVFVGGSGGALAEILNTAWARLARGGFLVASAVTEESKQVLLQFGRKHPEAELESMQIAVSRRSELAGQTLYRPQLPVTLFKWLKLS
ncbi:MAG: precorrin-6y C5,15-methyltransferase (decarboxylating) subunit CbiE [Gammaproteobacteria bacterium]|nr:precorrin-6y C5,15-methyltransferase (decarboxylating) subunit CbiE [Gammaproteobacteria bacterium]